MKKRDTCCITPIPRRWGAVIVVLVLGASVLAACRPGHSGGEEIAFLRGGGLWTISPDGSNLNQIESGGFIGLAWSPDHHQIVLRKQHGTLAQPESSFGQSDSQSELGVTAIDGGNILQITPPNSGLLRSDAWWDGSGNRLLYREEQARSDSAPPGAPGMPQWKLSQADQPAGIARKDLPTSLVLPAVNSDGSLIASIDASGHVLVGAPGESPRVLASGVLTILPGSGSYPARPLWQPGTNHLLYAIAGAASDETTLLLSDTNGHSQPVVTSLAHLQQYAWSPDGRLLLLQTLAAPNTGTIKLYQVYTATGVLQFAWDDAAERSLPFWSPDSRLLLLIEPNGLTLINIAARSKTTILRGSSALPPAPTSAEQAPFLRPAVNSPWKSDSSAFLFTDDGQGVWTSQPEQALRSRSGAGDGLYSSVLGNSAADARSNGAHFPTLLDWGEHHSVSWSTLDPNCAFLIV